MQEDIKTEESSEEFSELIKFTVTGYLGGLVLGGVLDYYALARSGLGQWAVRALAGEGESILEGYFALKKRVKGTVGSIAEAYGWGKLAGMIVPWVIDFLSRFVIGIDMYGVESFYVPFFYVMADQIGASVAGFIFIYRRSRTTRGAIGSYLTHPVMVTGLAIILIVFIGLAVARFAGFTPSTQVLTAVEATVANLCWLPPVVGWHSERKK